MVVIAGFTERINNMTNLRLYFSRKQLGPSPFMS